MLFCHFNCDIIVDMYNNTAKKLLIFMLSLALVISLVILDVICIAPNTLRLRRETLSSEKIPKALDGMQICYFSDLDYGLFTDEKRLNSIVAKINEVSPDVVIFGGDLYDSSVAPDETSEAVINKAFASIKAEYGKFAVYGDNDDSSDNALAATAAIYQNSGFEVLANTSISLHHKTSSSITLVGISDGIAGNCDIETAYSSVSSNNYVLTVCHTPDTADSVPTDLTDYFLAGHSHGGQVNYLFGALITPAMAVNHLRGKHSIQNAFTLDITDGVSTTEKNIRFLTSNEIVVYTLSHLSQKDSQS